MKRQHVGEPQTQGTPFQLSTNLKWCSESERSKIMCLSKYRCHVSSHAGYVKPAPFEVKSLHPLTKYPPKTQTLWIAIHHLHSGAHSLQTRSWPTWSSLEQGRTSHLTELSCCWACLTGEYQAYVANPTRAHRSGMCYKRSTAHSLIHKTNIRNMSEAALCQAGAGSWEPRGTLALSDLHRGRSNFSVRSLQTAVLCWLIPHQTKQREACALPHVDINSFANSSFSGKKCHMS